MNKNSNALAPFILGILSILFPFVGIVFGIIGLSLSIKLLKNEDSGKGFLVAGKVCSIIGICLQAVSILLAFIGFATFSYVRGQ